MGTQGIAKGVRVRVNESYPVANEHGLTGCVRGILSDPREVDVELDNGGGPAMYYVSELDVMETGEHEGGLNDGDD